MGIGGGDYETGGSPPRMGVGSKLFFYTLKARGVLCSTEKKTQPVKPGATRLHGLWENIAYVSPDMVRKH